MIDLYPENYISKIEFMNDCWIWKGAKSSGYGSYAVKRRVVGAHRVSWEIANKKKIPHDMCVLHKCDNPLCVNPEHLFIGTNKDNTLDMIKKGRMVRPKGEINGSSKLTWKKVQEIRELRTKGYTLKVLSEKYGVSQNQISLIVKNRRWIKESV